MKIMKGLIHVHSTYSYDGRHSIGEIAAFARERKYAFVAMSEHSDTLDSEKVARLQEDCQRASTSDCLIIPGIEFTCAGNLHLIGLGVQKYHPSKDPVIINDFIQTQGGVSVIAHPRRYQYQISSELLSAVNGVEIWNSGYDGRFFPSYRSLRLLQSGQERPQTLLAFGGQDLHTIQKEHAQVSTSLCCERLLASSILDAIRFGNFTISNGYFTVDGRVPVNFLRDASIYLGSCVYSSAKNLRARFI